MSEDKGHTMSTTEYAKHRVAGMKDYAKQVVYDNPMSSTWSSSDSPSQSERGTTEMAGHKIAAAKDYAKQVAVENPRAEASGNLVEGGESNRGGYKSLQKDPGQTHINLEHSDGFI